MREIETDYLVVGAGATGMAFVDTLVSLSDVDVVMVNGYGFPAQKGGPLFWASRRPRQQVSQALDVLAAATGYGFKRGNVEGVLDRLR